MSPFQLNLLGVTSFMLSVERTKNLLNDPALSDEEAEKIRDAFHAFAEIIFDQWRDERKAKKEIT